MSHQPFETWILDVETLPSEDRRVLQEHLESCTQCRSLRDKWHSVQHELRARVVAVPAPGFTQRWQAGLAERRAQAVRRQAWKVFLIFLGGAMVFLLALVAYVLSYSSPADWLAAVIRYGSYSLNLFDTLVSLLRLWLNATPLALNIALWIYTTITLCLLSLGWVFALWRTSIQGALSK
jgi:predicted anti-sigma-YlaC factor YlaD